MHVCAAELLITVLNTVGEWFLASGCLAIKGDVPAHAFQRSAGASRAAAGSNYGTASGDWVLLCGK
jgi:hypothetical protein